MALPPIEKLKPYKPYKHFAANFINCMLVLRDISLGTFFVLVDSNMLTHTLRDNPQQTLLNHYHTHRK